MRVLMRSLGLGGVYEWGALALLLRRGGCLGDPSLLHFCRCRRRGEVRFTWVP